ncbi:MAG: archaemetzincin family Zn-dependent metalloprotease [Desulfobacteraceae bacterium]|jgi:archaemetzincin
MSSKQRPICIVPIGKVSEITLKSIAAHILGYLNLDADIHPPLDHPTYAYDERRVQYDAGAILNAFESMPFHDYDKVIGLLDVDLYVPIFTHVFGEATQGGKFALVSLHRLQTRSEVPSSATSLQIERAAKVALHELGHLYNLHHCTDERCLMRFSGEIEDLDRTPLYFCRYCSVYLRDALTLSRPRDTSTEESKEV